MTIRTKKISSSIDKKKLQPLIQELLNDISFELLDDNKNTVEVCDDIQLFDELKLLSCMSYENETKPIAEIAKEESKLIIGSLGLSISDRDYLLDKRTYCIINENQPILGEFIIQSKIFPYFAKTTKEYTTYTIGKVIHVFDNYIYLDAQGKRKSEIEYFNSVRKIDLTKINHTPALNRNNSISSVQNAGIRRRDSIIKKTPISRGSTSSRRGNSSPLPKVAQNTKIYRLALVKF